MIKTFIKHACGVKFGILSTPRAWQLKFRQNLPLHYVCMFFRKTPENAGFSGK